MKKSPSLGYAESINVRYYHGELPPLIMEVLQGAEQRGPEIQELTERIVRSASEAGIPARRLSPLGLAEFGNGIAESRLPALNGDLIPPITLPGRHGKIDELVRLRDGWAARKMLDYGCAVPPHTTIDSSNAMPDWKFVGLDPFVQPYYLHDPDGNWAIFDNDGRCLKLVPGSEIDLKSRKSLFRDSGGRARFVDAFSTFESLIDKGETKRSEYVRGDWKLVAHPFSQYRTPRIEFVATESEAAEHGPYSVVRCMNVFMYNQARSAYLEWIPEILEPDGIVITGRDALSSAEATFFIHRFDGTELRADEFCFSVDCLRPYAIMPWFTYNDADPDTLAIVSISRTLRQNREFSRVLDATFDELWHRMGSYDIDENDCLVPTVEFASWPRALLEIINLIESIHIDDASIADFVAQELEVHGIRAWKNEIGFLSVDPQTIP
jgi:hypothetical protein